MCEVDAYVEHPYSVIYEVPNKVGATAACVDSNSKAVFGTVIVSLFIYLI